MSGKHFVIADQGLSTQMCSRSSEVSCKMGLHKSRSAAQVHLMIEESRIESISLRIMRR